MGNKEHRWRLHRNTFWITHLIPKLQKVRNILRVNRVPTPYPNKNLLALNSHVNGNLGGNLGGIRCKNGAAD
jgi:hypothetical protein